MIDAPGRPRPEVAVGVLLARRRQLTELYRAEHQRLASAVTDSACQESAARLIQLARLLAEVDDELTVLLQTPLRSHEKGWCRKTD